jgi:hypothetical protein
MKWYNEHHFHLRISKSRTSKFGDFRPAFKEKPNRISVNGDLNQYHFLVTLTHEVAHVANWNQHKNKVSPHGKEWQNTYSELLKELLQTVDFPDDLLTALNRHLKRPKASSCSDPILFKSLSNYNQQQKSIFLEDLPEGIVFSTRGSRIFKKGKKRRTRYECLEVNSQRIYLVSGHAEVEPINHP